MRVFALYNKKNEFIASFPTREGAEDYGVSMFGRENGWEFDIREMWMNDTPQNPLTTPLQHIPYTIPKPIQPPYQWTCGDGPKATFTGNSSNGWYDTDRADK